MTDKPTMNDVAREADVALGTVSKVLNGDATVKPALRDRVLDACQRLSYQRNRIAASLRSRQTHTIGVIIPDIINTFYAMLVERLEQLASAAGYTVVIVTTGEDARRADERIEILRQRQVDGMIVIPSLNGSFSLASAIGQTMPCVIVDRIGQDDVYPNVATDNVDATYQGTRYLLSLGHKHIVLAVNSPNLWNTQERILGFEKAIREANAKGEVRDVGMTVEEARMSLANLFREEVRPTALFTANNLVTLGAIRAQQYVDLSVPDEMSLLAFDDFDWLRLVRPAVSAIQQPIDQLAVEAWRLIFQQVSKLPVTVRNVRAGAQLIIRQSTAAPTARGRKLGVL
jgi:LacI family transcriptional regulator